MAEIYTCASCGTTTTEKGHLCNPTLVEDACDLCSEPVQDARHICKPMRSQLEYVCGGCGRPATSPDLVCRPEKMGG